MKKSSIVRKSAIQLLIAAIAVFVLQAVAFVVVRTVPFEILIAKYETPMVILTVALLLSWLLVIIFGVKVAYYAIKYRKDKEER